MGEFYVEDRCCTNCGVPQATAPTLFSEDESQCFVVRQPDNARELEQMLDVLGTQELGCIRYAGRRLDVIATVESWGDNLDIIDAPPWLRTVARLVGGKLPSGRRPR